MLKNLELQKLIANWNRPEGLIHSSQRIRTVINLERTVLQKSNSTKKGRKEYWSMKRRYSTMDVHCNIMYAGVKRTYLEVPPSDEPYEHGHGDIDDEYPSLEHRNEHVLTNKLHAGANVN
jgi:hypothetical protein